MHPGCQIAQVYLCRAPIDFMKSIDGLSVLVEQELQLNLFGSALYVFVNRHHSKIKALYWHRNGFCLWQKRLEADKFAWPRAQSIFIPAALTMGAHLWASRVMYCMNCSGVVDSGSNP